MAAKSSGSSSATPIPWLAVVLVLASAGLTIYAHGERDRAVEAMATALAESRTYFLEHPYLEPGPLLATHLGGSAIASSRQAFETQRIERGSVRTPAGIVRRQQTTLDALVASAVADTGRLPARRLGVVPSVGPSVAWLSYPLLHGGNAHLLGNALLLLFFGLYLELAFGGLGFASLAISVAIAGAASFSAAVPDLDRTALIGSSPVLAGLGVAFALRYRAKRAEGFYLAGLILGAVWLALPPWAGLTWSFAEARLVSAGPPLSGSSVFYAYAGSMGCGAAFAMLAAALRKDGRVRRPTSGPMSHPLFVRAMRARDQGQQREAFDALRQLVREQPEAYEAALALWDVSNELGRSGEAASALVCAIRVELKRGNAETAVAHWLELADAGLPADAEPALLIRMALLLREYDQPRDAARALRTALERSSEGASPVVATRVAKAARDLDPRIAEAAAWRALGSEELTLADRQNLESLLAEVLPPPSEARTQGLHAPVEESDPEPPEARPEERPESPARPAAIELEINERVLDVVFAVPLELDDDGVHISTKSGAKKLLRYERIQAVAVAAVHGLGPKPVILVDLVLNWMTTTNETLRVIRFRGDRFDPRRVVPESSSPVDALRGLVKTILDRSRGVPLPDPEGALGHPFVSFDDIRIYQRAVLMVEAGEGCAG